MRKNAIRHPWTVACTALGDWEEQGADASISIRADSAEAFGMRSRDAGGAGWSQTKIAALDISMIFAQSLGVCDAAWLGFYIRYVDINSWDEQ